MADHHPVTGTTGAAAIDADHHSRTLGVAPGAIAAMAFAAFWLQLLGHEAAHAWGRDLFAGHTDLSLRWPRRVQLAFFAGGPAFTLLLTLVAAAAALRVRASHWRMAAASAGVSAASRSVWTGIAAVLDQPHDERTLDRLLHLPAGTLELVEVLVTAAALAAILRVLPSPVRRATLAWIVLGVVAGWASAITIGNALGLPVGVF